MFYIIETNYTGPNQDQDQYVDADRIEISTAPARTNSSNEVCIEGWCGTTDDWAMYARGEYATIEEARAAIAKRFGEMRHVENYDEHAEDVVEAYKPGKYEPMSASATGDWIADGLNEIGADTSDAEIALFVRACQETCRTDHGCDLDEDTVAEAAMDRRQELRDEREEA